MSPPFYSLYLYIFNTIFSFYQLPQFIFSLRLVRRWRVCVCCAYLWRRTGLFSETFSFLFVCGWPRDRTLASKLWVTVLSWS